jgi:DNA-binding protein
MKKILFLLGMTCLVNNYVSANDFTLTLYVQNSEEITVKRNGLIYEFSHSISGYEVMESRFIQSINREKVIVSEVSLANNLCRLTFVEGVTDVEIQESLRFATQVFGYTSFKVSSL